MSSSACKNNLQPASILCSCCFFMFIGIPVFIIQPILQPDETEWNIIGIIFFVVVAIPIALFFMLKYAFACFPVEQKMQTKNRDFLPQSQVVCISTISDDYSVSTSSSQSPPSTYACNLEPTPPPKYDPPPSYNECTIEIDKQICNQYLTKFQCRPKEEIA